MKILENSRWGNKAYEAVSYISDELYICTINALFKFVLILIELAWSLPMHMLLVKYAAL